MNNEAQNDRALGGRTATLNYQSVQIKKRYTGLSIITLVAGLLSGPIIAGPLVGSMWFIGEDPYAPWAWLILGALFVGFCFAVAIPLLGYREARRLRNLTHGGFRGTKIIQIGLTAYAFWMLPVAILCSPVLLILFLRWPRTTTMICKTLFTGRSRRV